MKNLVLTVILCLSLSLQAQMRKANNYFDCYRFDEAAELYQKVIKKGNPKHLALAYTNLGHSYRMLRQNKNALESYLNALEQKDVSNEVVFYLAHTQRGEGLYDEAISNFEKYAKLTNNNHDALKYAEYCRIIKEWDEFEELRSVKNLEEVNTEASEYSPVIYNNKMVFVSDKNSEKGYRRSEFKVKSIQKSKLYWSLVDSLNESHRFLSKTFSDVFHHGPASIARNDSLLFFTRVFVSGVKGKHMKLRTSLLKIFVSNYKNGRWSAPESFALNEDTSSVAHPALSKDGNTVYYVSDRHGSHGQADLYVSHFRNGKWSEPENLGDKVNTPGKEMFPFLANDSTLYFSSDSHCGYGGLDVYKTIKKDGKWTKPINLKYPINSPADDFGLVISDSGSGFFSSNRENGVGSDDIYSFKPRIVPRKILVTGVIKGYNAIDFPNMNIFALNTSTREVNVVQPDEKGNVELEIKRGNKYKIRVSDSKHLPHYSEFYVDDKRKVRNTNLFNEPLTLETIPIESKSINDTVYFDLDKFDIRDDAAQSLNEMLPLIEVASKVYIKISAYTDIRGSDEYNINLSESRAMAVKKYFEERDIEVSSIEWNGLGEVVLDENEELNEDLHQKCRRAEIHVDVMIRPVISGEKAASQQYLAGSNYNLSDFGDEFFIK